MSRFADPNATKRMPLGACQCPGTPHTGDWLELRTEVGADDQVAIARSSEPNVEALSRLLVAWNIEDSDGVVPPIDREHIGLLFGDVFEILDGWLIANIKFTTPLPNVSAAPSGSSTGVTPSRTPTPRKGGSSTTSFSPPVDGAATSSGSPLQSL